ncbi:MAG: hypothetical protein AAGD32_01385 [Planctomycetota bacterium]
MILICLMLVLVGCRGNRGPTTVDDTRFAAERLRLHPIFTRPADFQDDPAIDGIAAVVEFTDRFGDPVKASGNVIFEVYAYQPNSPDPRGDRLGEPWTGSIATLDLQERRWNKSLRAYDFELEWDAAGDGNRIVLQATMNLLDGRRLSDTLVLDNRDPGGPPPAADPDDAMPPNSPTMRMPEP